MAISNFKTLHSAIKALVVAQGFRYIPIKKWYSLEMGVYPSSLKNDAFTIKFSNMDDSTFETEDWGRLNVSLEFVLDAHNDLYLNKIDDCLTAVKSLRSLSTPELETRTETKQNFTSSDVLDKVLLTFSDINIDIRSV